MRRDAVAVRRERGRLVTGAVGRLAAAELGELALPHRLEALRVDVDPREDGLGAHRRDRLADVLEGIEAAARAGLSPIKVNTLVLRGMNEADLPDLVDYCLDRGIELRVIEQMPIGPADTWDRQNIMTADEILHIMSTRHTLTPSPREDPHSPAGRWIVDGDPSKRLGVIASVSDPFCNACDRTRLTSDGMVRSCLFSTEETSLRDLLRGGGDDAQIAARWADAMWMKPAAHGLNLDAFARPSRTMSRIGG